MHYTRLDVVANHPSGSVVPAKGTHPQRYTTRTVFHHGPFLGVDRMNLIELILKQLLSGDMLGNLAGELGASTEDAKKAISASVPAMLSGIGSLASKPEGADKLWTALEQVDDSAVRDFGSMLTGAHKDALAQSGTSILESLVGKRMLGSLVDGLGGFLGGKTTLVTRLLPMLAPMVLGLIS
jgi:hypothetical protein